MKRLINRGLSAVMAAVMLMTVLVSAPFTVNADDSEPEFVFSEETNYYDGSKYLKLIKYNGSDENVVVPDRVPDDYPDENLRGREFSIIAENAFENNANIKSVTMGDNIGHIAGYCFANCSELTEVKIGTGLTYFGRSVFSGCTSLKKIRILSQKTDFGMDPYAINNDLDVVVYGYSGTVLEQKMRQYGVTFVPIDHTLRRVAKVDPTQWKNGNIEYWYYTDTEEYFNNSLARKEDEITEQQTVLPYFSFEYSNENNGYYKLTKYNGNSPYVTIPETIPDNYPDASLRGKTVTVIYDDAFKGNTNITSVTIPDSIEYVNDNSFYGCSNLKTVDIGIGLRRLGGLCFANCTELEKVTINSKKDTFNMEYSAFSNSPEVTVYGYCGTMVQKMMDKNNIPFESLGHTYGNPVWSWSEDKSSVTATFTCEKCQEEETVNATIKIDRTEPTGATDGEVKYTATVVFNEQTYTDVKTEVFPKLHDLRHIEKVIPKQEQNGNIEYWYCPECGKYFSDADGTKEITQAETILPYFTYELIDGKYTLTGYNGNDGNITVPEKIPDNYPDVNLRGKDISVIGDQAFWGNPFLKKVVLQDNITKVGVAAFKSCYLLTAVQIGSGLTDICNACFKDCPGLYNVTIYSKNNEMNFGDRIFEGSTHARVYCYHYTAMENWAKEKSITHSAIEHYLKASEWQWTGNYSYAYVTLVCEAGDYTDKLEAQVTSEVTKQATCTEEGEITYTATRTYEGKTYTDVKTAPLPKKHKLERVEKVYPTEDRHGNIEYWRCPDCGKLFADENGEEEITQADTVLPLFTFGYDGDHLKLLNYNGNDENVIVPDKVPEDYPNEDLRGKEYYIIKEAAFRNNTTLKKIILPDNIHHIAAYAFDGCTQLTEVTIGEGLSYLNFCFRDCPVLTKVTIYSVDPEFTMSNSAFDGSYNVTVYGYRNTAVQSEMDNYGIPFIPLDPEEIEEITYTVDKTWDIDFAEKDKPGSIQVVLQRKKSARSWETLQLVTLDETTNHWKAEFAPVPSAYEDEEDGRLVEYKYRIRELGPKKAEDAELDPNAEDFQEKVKDRLIYDTWDFDRPIITQIINNAKDPEVIWQFEPNVEWVKNLAKTTTVSPPFVKFDIDGYNDGVKDIPKHTTKYMVTYESDDEYPDKTNITNLAILDTTVYKRWLNFEESEKPESVYLMLESKAQTEYAAANGLTQANFYTPSFDAVVGSLNLTDIPISGETIRNRVNEGISKNLDGPLSPLSTMITAGTDALFTEYFSTGLTVGKATPDSQNPLTRWRVKFTVKKYGMGEKRLPMDYAGAELVTGMMEMIIDALIHRLGYDFSVPVMYEPFGQYWSIKGYALSLIHDYERTCNVINVKFHSGDGDPNDPDNRAQVIGGTKYWKDDDAPDRPESINLHVYYKDDGGTEQEVQGMPVTVTSGDTNGENGWTWMLKIPADSPDRYKNYYIREDLPEGYEASYMGLDLIDSKSQTEPTTEEPTTEEPTTEVTETTEDPSTVVAEPTEEPSTAVTEPTEEPSTVVTEPTEEPSTLVTEPTEEPTTVVTEPPEEESTQKTEPKTDPDDDDDDDDDDPGNPVVPVPVIVPPDVPGPGGPGGPDTPDDPDDPTKPTEATEATEATETTEATEETEPTEPDTLIVKKIWIGDTEDVRPSYIKIHIYNAGVEIAGSPVKLSKSKFAGLSTWVSNPIKLSEGVNKNTLTYAETYPSGYQNRDNYASVVFGSTIFNTWLQTNITGTKTWIDGGNILNKRPDEITVNLKADGTIVDTVKTNASKGWKYSFTNKPIFKTENDVPVKINYTVEEEAVNDYVATYDGYNITNTLSSSVTAKGCYKFKYNDRYGVERLKTVEVDLKNQEILGYSGNNNQPGVPTYLWTEEAKQLFDNKNPLLTAALAVTGNEDDPQKDVSVYKNDIEWDLIKSNADDATNMTPDSSGKSLTVLAQTKPHTFTFHYYFVKDGSTEYRGTKTDIPYGKPVTFSPEFTDPEKYEYINEEIPQENFCYWSADEAGLIPITTNRTFGMLMKGKWDENADSDRVVNVYAQYSNNLTDDWMPLIEEATFTHMIDDDYNWVYLDYMTNYLSKDGTVVKDLVAQGDENIRYGLIAVKHPDNSSALTRDEMINLTQSMIADDSAAVYTDDSKQSVAYRFEYGKQGDMVKPITNFNRALYTLQTDTEKAQNMQFSVMAYITVDGTNYFYSKVNNDINVHELLSE